MKTQLALLSLLVLCACATIPSPEPVQRVYVFKYDGARQCQTDSIPLDKMEEQLTDNGIKVFERCKHYDGIPSPAVCGARTGRMNVYTIQESDLEQAEKLGFKKPVKTPGVCIERGYKSKPKSPFFLKKPGASE